MMVGSSMFSKLKIKVNEDGIIDIITNKIDSNKTIGKFKLYKVEIPLFDNYIADITTLLELLESLREPYDNNRLLEVVRKCISNYNDSAYNKHRFDTIRIRPFFALIRAFSHMTEYILM